MENTPLEAEDPGRRIAMIQRRTALLQRHLVHRQLTTALIGMITVATALVLFAWREVTAPHSPVDSSRQPAALQDDFQGESRAVEQDTPRVAVVYDLSAPYPTQYNWLTSHIAADLRSLGYCVSELHLYGYPIRAYWGVIPLGNVWMPYTSEEALRRIESGQDLLVVHTASAIELRYDTHVSRSTITSIAEEVENTVSWFGCDDLRVTLVPRDFCVRDGFGLFASYDAVIIM